MTTPNTVPINTGSTRMLPPWRLTADNESEIFVPFSNNINNIYRHSRHEAILNKSWAVNMWGNFL